MVVDVEDEDCKVPLWFDVPVFVPSPLFALYPDGPGEFVVVLDVSVYVLPLFDFD